MGSGFKNFLPVILSCGLEDSCLFLVSTEDLFGGFYGFPMILSDKRGKKKIDQKKQKTCFLIIKKSKNRQAKTLPICKPNRTTVAYNYSKRMVPIIFPLQYTTIEANV